MQNKMPEVFGTDCKSAPAVWALRVRDGADARTFHYAFMPLHHYALLLYLHHKSVQR